MNVRNPTSQPTDRSTIRWIKGYNFTLLGTILIKRNC